MSTAAEKLASNINFGVLGQAKELKSRIWFTIIALIVYRFGTYIPLANIDPHALSALMKHNAGGVLGIFNMFSGGALGRMTIFALNIMPYITASIIIQLMTVVSSHMEALKKEGETGRRKITQYTRYATVILATFQGLGIAIGLEGMQGGSSQVVLDPGLFFRLTTVTTLVGGTLFLMWLGEQITNRGIGNGVSLIIFSGIVANLPNALASTFDLGRTGAISTWVIIMLLILAVAVIASIVFMERAHRRIIVQYPKRQKGNKVFGGESSHIPLKLNTAGVIPPIFASSILLFPATLAGFNSNREGISPILETIVRYISHGQPLYIVLYVAIIIFFCFFYTSIVFNPDETAENLKKNGGFVPGRRPGKNTAEYFDYVLTRLTVIGAIYLSAICVLPELLISNYSVPFYLGGTSLLIVVNVLLDTLSQVQTHLFAHQYEGLIKKSKLKGRRR
jgi:preprotein translocase subunit SecY